jgi:uncharacterized protein YabN with tetrapyrrole methylase and pyrophosphatase domain
MNKAGSLVCVGTGMMLGAHITPRSRSYIENADVVFVAVSDGIVEKWIEEMNSDVRSLQIYYQEGKSRKITYQQMEEAMMIEVRAGKNVCGAFYGHPGVFALAPHKSIKQAKKEGFEAHMEPGISAEDCLIADLGIDPGIVGCQQYEASQFILYSRIIDLSAYLILWQVGIVGDRSYTKFSTSLEYKKIFMAVLLEHYSEEQPIILYEAPTLPISKTRMDNILLKDLLDHQLNAETTMIIPPSSVMVENQLIREQLATLDSNHS